MHLHYFKSSYCNHVLCCIFLVYFASQYNYEVEATTRPSVPPIDDRCEFIKAVVNFERAIFSQCEIEQQSCFSNNTKQLDEIDPELISAHDACTSQPLSIAPGFSGPCPRYMEKLESLRQEDLQTLLTKLSLRTLFHRTSPTGTTKEIYRFNESYDHAQQ